MSAGLRAIVSEDRPGLTARSVGRLAQLMYARRGQAGLRGMKARFG